MKGKTLTGVGGVLSCAHRDIDTGKLHGHTWEVVAWFEQYADARTRAAKLNEVLGLLDHTELPWKLSWAEELAKHIAKQIGFPCSRVDVNRPSERFFASFIVAQPTSKKRWTTAETSRAVTLRGLGFTYAEIAYDLKGRTTQSVKRRIQSVLP